MSEQLETGLWKAQCEWHLRRRTLLTKNDADISEEEMERAIQAGLSPLEFVREFIEDRDLDDCVERPEVGPSSAYWREWERQNPLPSLHPAGN
jgi:hypothetical protein